MMENIVSGSIGYDIHEEEIDDSLELLMQDEQKYLLHISIAS